MDNTLINGQASQQVDIADRGFTYGDGVFETIQVFNDKPLLWQAHLQRMQQGANRLSITFNASLIDQYALDFEKLKQQNTPNGVLKLTLTRGIGKRGYKADNNAQPTRITSLTALPDMRAEQSGGVTVTLCDTQLARQPLLAGIKHLNRLEQVLARSEWDNPNIKEGIVCDTQDYIVEGCMSNVFWVKDGVLYTPSMQYAGVEGVVRNTIIALSEHHNIATVKVGYYKLATLLSAQEVFVTNSVFNVLPVTHIKVKNSDESSLTLAVGPVTQALQKHLWQFYLKE